MDYYNNIIQLIPGIFVSDNKITSSQNKLNDFNINYVININKIITDTKVTSFNILVNSNNQFYDTSELLKIDFNKTNEFIINALQNNSNILIDISFASWGTNNVLTILDIKSAGRSTTQPRGCSILSGQIYADNSGSNQFDNFINVGLTRKDCSLTTSSPGPYTLRLNIDPAYQMDIYSGSLNIINATSRTDITSISIRKG